MSKINPHKLIAHINRIPNIPKTIGLKVSLKAEISFPDWGSLIVSTVECVGTYWCRWSNTFTISSYFDSPCRQIPSGTCLCESGGCGCGGGGKGRVYVCMCVWVHECAVCVSVHVEHVCVFRCTQTYIPRLTFVPSQSRTHA